MRGTGFVLGLVMLFGLAGCGDDAPVRTDLPYELYCNIATGDCQRAIYDSVAAKLGASDFGRPEIRTISVEQHANEVRSGVDLQDLTGEDPFTRGLRLIGFLPEASESLTATQIEFQIEQIAAYYSSRSDMITVIDRAYEEVDAQALMAHEFTHAIQERQFGFDEIWSGVDSEDSSLGVRSVVEGDANHTGYSWVYDQLGYLPGDIDWDEIHQDNRERLDRDVLDPEVALIDTASYFPYTYGFAYMNEITLADGLPGRAAAFEMPPSAAFEVMTGPDGPRPGFDFPDVVHPEPVDGHTYEIGDRFGSWYVHAFLRRNGLSAENARAAALDWRGDELAIYESGPEVAAVWRVRFDADAARTVHDLVDLDGEGSAKTAVLYEDDLFVFAAESDQALIAWAEQPLDTMTAALVLKDGRRRGGGVSVGTCLKSRHFSLPIPPPLLD